MHVPKHMRQRPVGIRTRVFAVIGVLVGVWQVTVALQSGSIFRTLLGLAFIGISVYWLFTRDKTS